MSKEETLLNNEELSDNITEILGIRRDLQRHHVLSGAIPKIVDLINTQKRVHAESVISTDKVTRFEVIDHRECVWCRGRLTENRLQKNGEYKLVPCSKCYGSGIMGGRVYTVSSNPERSIIKVELSYQDDGKTLKVFISDKENA